VTAVRILVAEDMGIATDMARAELTQAMPCEPVLVADPVTALDRLRRERFDVAVVDMLFQAHSDEFERRRRDGKVRLTDARLHLSGLALLQAAGTAGTPAVLWTSGEPNRRLHMMFAHEQLGCRGMCPKDVKGKLAAAVQAVVAGREYIDPILRMHLPPRCAPSLRETFFSSGSRRAMWRAMALGLHDHARIGRAVGVVGGTVRRSVEEMRSKLVAFDPGCSREGPPTAELVRYASQNWEFFLDDTVREVYP
jgi:DNA-binding NarL/FixJ family response regulator